MYHNFSIIISSLDNIKAIQNELHFSKSINLTTTLAAIPLTQYFMDKFEEINPEYEIIPELEYDNFEKYYFLIKYSSTPIVLYTISYKMGLGGRGDQSWLFKDGSLVSTYFDEKKSIGHVLNIALNESNLLLGEVSKKQLDLTNSFKDSPITFSKLGLKFIKHAEDFFEIFD